MLLVLCAFGALNLAAPRTAQAEAQRLVALNPSLTETLLALGAGDRLVGVDDYSQRQLAEVAALPNVGGLFDPDLEAIVALRPDAVLLVPGAEQRGLAARLEELGVRVLAFPNHTLDELLDSIAQLGALVERSEAAAARVDAIRAALAAARARSAQRAPQRVVLVLQRDPFFVVGGGSYIDALLEAAGGENAGRSVPGPYPQVDLEWLLAAAPEVILDASPGRDAPAEFWRRWPSLPAVRAGRIERLDEIAWRPGPHIERSLELLESALASTASSPAAANVPAPHSATSTGSTGLAAGAMQP